MEDFIPLIWEVTDAPEAAEQTVGGVGLRRFSCPPDQAEALKEEASRWQVTEHVRYEKTLYWHNDDTEKGSYITRHSSAWVVKDGGFYGFLVSFSDTDGFGMSSRSEPKTLLLTVDGKAFGDKERHASRGSTETDLTETGVFVLEPAKKQGTEEAEQHGDQ